MWCLMSDSDTGSDAQWQLASVSGSSLRYYYKSNYKYKV